MHNLIIVYCCVPRPIKGEPIVVADILTAQPVTLVNRFNHTSWVTAVTPTDRPKSVPNSCVIKVFGGVFMLSRYFFGLFCGCRGFCHRTESALFLFLLDKTGYGLGVKP